MQQILVMTFSMLVSNYTVYAQSTKADDFTWQKKRVDSLVQRIDTNSLLSKQVFTGKCSEGEYHATCYYNKAAKEIVKTNYKFNEDSTGIKTAYYNANILIKVIDNSKSYYVAWDSLLDENGTSVDPATYQTLLSILNESWQPLYKLLFR
jgi:hypothetical protein